MAQSQGSTFPKFIVFAFAVLMLVGGTGCSDLPSKNDEDPAPKYSIDGRVAEQITIYETGGGSAWDTVGISGLELKIGDNKVTTSQEGKFSLSNLTPGEYQISLLHPRYTINPSDSILNIDGKIPPKSYSDSTLSFFAIPDRNTYFPLEINSGWVFDMKVSHRSAGQATILEGEMTWKIESSTNITSDSIKYNVRQTFDGIKVEADISDTDTMSYSYENNFHLLSSNNRVYFSEGIRDFNLDSFSHKYAWIHKAYPFYKPDTLVIGPLVYGATFKLKQDVGPVYYNRSAIGNTGDEYYMELKHVL